jgi:hypothetical protein
MTLSEFIRSTSEAKPPSGLSPALLALWHDKKGDWHASHEVAQEIKDSTGSWIHAYLHRKEGDSGNAAYWYRRANKPDSSASLDAEWEEIAADLLDSH